MNTSAKITVLQAREVLLQCGFVVEICGNSAPGGRREIFHGDFHVPGIQFKAFINVNVVGNESLIKQMKRLNFKLRLQPRTYY